MELHQTDRILPERRNHITHQSGRSPGRKKFIETSMKTVGGVAGENSKANTGTEENHDQERAGLAYVERS